MAMAMAVNVVMVFMRAFLTCTTLATSAEVRGRGLTPQ
jgi:hypothetical protein